ncbi:hypothetical protein A1359_21590 [Methylomonas lenta]|uniref:Uncharacterized protein n=1 Tax=Methylomonas lenta TaxID=980561 RepID=A0A177NP17_9GAMM|nr:hypothetical protein A1359_21590 [Methylomonas lenta]
MIIVIKNFPNPGFIWIGMFKIFAIQMRGSLLMLRYFILTASIIFVAPAAQMQVFQEFSIYSA